MGISRSTLRARWAWRMSRSTRPPLARLTSARTSPVARPWQEAAVMPLTRIAWRDGARAQEPVCKAVAERLRPVVPHFRGVQGSGRMGGRFGTTWRTWPRGAKSGGVVEAPDTARIMKRGDHRSDICSDGAISSRRSVARSPWSPRSPVVDRHNASVTLESC